MDVNFAMALYHIFCNICIMYTLKMQFKFMCVVGLSCVAAGHFTLRPDAKKLYYNGLTIVGEHLPIFLSRQWIAKCPGWKERNYGFSPTIHVDNPLSFILFMSEHPAISHVFPVFISQTQIYWSLKSSVWILNALFNIMWIRFYQNKKVWAIIIMMFTYINKYAA